MAARVRIRPSGHLFLVEGGDSILQAGLKAGHALAYGCSNGNCGDCRARLVDGALSKIRHSDFVFTAAQKAQGEILMCINAPASDDVVLEAVEAANTDEMPSQDIPIRIRRIDKPTDDVVVIHARTPRTQRFRFLAGQSVDLTIPGIGTRRLPVASCPCDDRNLEFHVPRAAQTDGDVARHLFESAAVDDRIDLSGPHGSFVLQEGDRRMIFIAQDTGFAPVRSLIEHAMSLNEDAAISLYWAATREGGHYLANLCRSWADAYDDFRYTAVDGGDPAGLMAGVADDHADFAACDVYAAGPPTLLDAARAHLTEYGLPKDRLSVETVV